MVARIVCGKSIRGVLNYNENKIETAEAELLSAAGFLRNPDQLSFKNKLDRFEMLTIQNEMAKTNALHITLNFSPTDILDNNKMLAIANDYMNGIGFGGQPYLVYRHYDAAHPHLHIATVNIKNGGERIETHNLGKNQSEKIRKEIEIWYAITKAEDQKKEMGYMLRPASLEKAMYGKRETKAMISAIVREVVSTYRFTSIPELNATLKQFNVMAYGGAEGTRMKEKGGLVYCILNDQGEPQGIPIKASSIYSSPTLKNLEQRFKPNEMSRKPYGVRIKHLLDKTIAKAKDRRDLEQKLWAQGIRILMRKNTDGLVYGITFIDNATRCVFNGSDLGKAYSAKAFTERLSELPVMSEEKNDATPPFEPTEIQQGNYPASDLPVIITLLDMALTSYLESEPDPYRKRKKKKLQQES